MSLNYLMKKMYSHAIVASHWKQWPYDVLLICSRHVFAEIFDSTWQRSATSVSPSFLWAPSTTKRNNFDESYARHKSEYGEEHLKPRDSSI
jgi:hypothetical protein